jgi:hypothetical protein
VTGAVSGRTDEDASARDRLSWLVRHARTMVLALGLLVVALAVGVTWTLGVFSGESANPQNVVTSGRMRQVNSAGNAAIMQATDLVPGQSVAGAATIRNEGDASGSFTMRVTDLEDTPGPGGGRLSDALRVKVVQRGASGSVYDGPMRGLQAELGTWQPEEERTYDITVSLPSNDSGDDAYQLSTVTATFTWEAVQA